MKLTLEYSEATYTSEWPDEYGVNTNPASCAFDKLAGMLELSGFHRETIRDIQLEIAEEIQQERAGGAQLINVKEDY